MLFKHCNIDKTDRINRIVIGIILFFIHANSNKLLRIIYGQDRDTLNNFFFANKARKVD